MPFPAGKEPSDFTCAQLTEIHYKRGRKGVYDFTLRQIPQNCTTYFVDFDVRLSQVYLSRELVEFVYPVYLAFE